MTHLLGAYSRRLGFTLVVLVAAICFGCIAGEPKNTATTRPATTAVLDPAATQPTDYTLNPGDVLEVKFFYQPELNDTLTVRPDGKISPQLIDEIPAGGMTVPQLKGELIHRYTGILRKPEVSVAVKEMAEQRVFIGGEVLAPGALPLKGRVTALQAIMQAGGMKPTAESKQIIILRYQGSPQPLFLTLNLGHDLRSGEAETNDIALRPMDIVFVPKTLIAKMDDFVEQYIDKLIVGSRTVGVFYDLNNLKQI